MKKVLAVVLVLSLAGCLDSRIKRASSLVNVKTQVEAKEFNEAKTDAEKLQIAKRHFETLPPYTQVLDDYMHGRDVAPTAEEQAKAAIEKWGAK